MRSRISRGGSAGRRADTPVVSQGAAAREGGDARRRVLGTLARARIDELEAAWQDWDTQPAVRTLRGPEFGLVMTRGRVGGGGAPFNIGEVTMTRAVVQLGGGEVGFGHCLGRSGRKALLVATFDALWQTAERDRVEERLVAPVARRLAEAASTKNRQTAATRVNFFTLVRGED